ncbi:unnamed protein product [Brassicogethes aeneus]|uniref:Glucose-methanol-choline oxidoreductase N-terminal domain-containing protein n=1 Tax=Brassicogethes aeneus TaxID=1431903 RepID=A0A9P0FBG2_BRAAE|nr:unnamed protein product [Brassicogethes aeneus]
MIPKLIVFLALTVTVLSQNAEEFLKVVEKSVKHATERKGRIFNPAYVGSTYKQYAGAQHRPTFLYNQQPVAEEKFDFIVVGSGSAGSVVANRLSENPDWKILLLEVGEEASFLTDIPAIAPIFQFTNYNWNYLAEKQENVCLGLDGQRMAWPRGRAVGGSSIINYMIHVRGNRRDYDRWAASGNPGWSYEDVLPYFIKSEDARVEKQDGELRGRGGYLTVSDVPFRSESAHAFVRGAQEVGHKYVDYNGADQLGVSYVQADQRDGYRCSTEKAFLRPARERPNLKILAQARAIKILINPKTNSAFGITYVKNRQYFNAYAKKEVILSAGAFNSPQLLMLSGIGPKEHLQELDIPLVKDLPVGQKLYDHLTFFGQVFTVNQSIVNLQKAVTQPSAFVELLFKGRGPLTSLGGVEALAYIKTNVSRDPDPSFPDVEIIFVGGSLSTDNGDFYRKTFKVSDEIYNAVFGPLENGFTWMGIPMLVHPRSVGYLKLKSKNPYHWPKFYGNYFTDPENLDIKTFIAAIREVQRISDSPSMQKYGSTLVTTKIPGCQHHTFNSDEYWECSLRHISATLHHQVATCKMGPSHDPEAVVDSKLRVYGVKRLRVVDSSVIPMPPTAHTNAPSVMIGEKASDLIKEDWIKAKGNIRSKDIRRHSP